MIPRYEHFGGRVWNSRTIGIDQGDDAAAWVTTFISRERPGSYRVVRMPDDGTRPSKRGRGDARVR
jgi:hypothetical protein